MADNNGDLDAILWGARNIAPAANTSERSAYHRLQNGLIPGVKIGKVWTSTKRRLLARINGEDGWTPPPKPASPPSSAPPRVARSRKRKPGERHRVEAR